MITKRNLPVAKITKAQNFRFGRGLKKDLDLFLFGVLASSGGSAVELAAEFRKKVWLRKGFLSLGGTFEVRGPTSAETIRDYIEYSPAKLVKDSEVVD